MSMKLLGIISVGSVVTDLLRTDQNTETLLEASRDIGLEINAEKTKYIIISRHPNSGQNQNIRTANELFENMAKFKYLGMTQMRMAFMMKSRVD
jgi:hypothetical protein